MGLFRPSTGIELCIDNQYFNGYDKFKRSTVVSKREWEIHLLRGCPSEFTGYASVTTTVRKSMPSSIIEAFNIYPFYGKYVIPVIDCDSMENLIIAKRILNIKQFKCATYISSPNKYWLIVDVICKIREAIIHMKMPGNDKKFIDMCQKLETINLRVSPKAGYLVQPEMIENTCTNRDVLSWIDNFNSVLSSDIVKNAYEIIRIDQALEAGEAAALLSSPNFKLSE